MRMVSSSGISPRGNVIVFSFGEVLDGTVIAGSRYSGLAKAGTSSATRHCGMCLYMLTLRFARSVWSAPRLWVGPCTSELRSEYRVGQDNGPELTADIFVDWLKGHGDWLAFIQPGKPNQIAFVKHGNSGSRNDVLDAWLFNSACDVQGPANDCVTGYTDVEAHESLGNVTPWCSGPWCSTRRDQILTCPFDAGAYAPSVP